MIVCLFVFFLGWSGDGQGRIAILLGQFSVPSYTHNIDSNAELSEFLLVKKEMPERLWYNLLIKTPWIAFFAFVSGREIYFCGCSPHRVNIYHLLPGPTLRVSLF